MANPICTTKKFVVGWSKRDEKGKRVFFISHSELGATRKDPIVCDPLELGARLTKLADQIERDRKKSP